MPLKLYSYKTCSTCKKAIRYLNDMGLDYQNLDIVENPPKKAELTSMLEQYQGNIKKLFNTSGQLYREMSLGLKLPDMSQEEALSLLSEHGKLVKRPFLVKDEASLVVGFKTEEWDAALR